MGTLFRVGSEPERSSSAALPAVLASCIHSCIPFDKTLGDWENVDTFHFASEKRRTCGVSIKKQKPLTFSLHLETERMKRRSGW